MSTGPIIPQDPWAEGYDKGCRDTEVELKAAISEVERLRGEFNATRDRLEDAYANESTKAASYQRDCAQLYAENEKLHARLAAATKALEEIAASIEEGSMHWEEGPCTCEAHIARAALVEIERGR